jgi:hypothetical protein
MLLIKLIMLLAQTVSIGAEDFDNGYVLLKFCMESESDYADSSSQV